MASTYQAWNPNVIRSTVAVVNVPDDAIRAMPAPTLLINAKDDQLTPLIGSEMIKSNLKTTLLYVPEYGGHSNLVKNDSSMERLTHFMISDGAMMFVTDVLLDEQLLSKWNLPGDKAFVRYYNCGRGLAEIERLERRARLLRWSSGDHQEEKNTIAADKAKVLRSLDLPSDKEETPRDRLMAEMMRVLGRMSAPARQAVDNSGVWWRDDGAAHVLPDKRKHSVATWPCVFYIECPEHSVGVVSGGKGELNRLLQVLPLCDFPRTHGDGGEVEASREIASSTVGT